MKGKEILSEQKKAMNPKEVKIFSLEEVSFHADQNSCWIVIKDGVYDMTDFVGEVWNVKLVDLRVAASSYRKANV